MERIYHRYELWECHKAGFFDKVVELFSNKKATKKYMQTVIEEWKYSCEHNLTK